MDSKNSPQDYGIPESNYQTLLPPPEAYLYFPQSFPSKQIYLDDECKYQLGKLKYRRMFDGQIQLDSEDDQNLDIFYQQMKINNITVDEKIWNRAQTLRFLQANSYKYDKTLKSMQDYEQWLLTLPPKLEDSTAKFLKSGVMYLQGRDSKFRPIFVMNITKIDLKVMPIEAYLQGLTYFLEVVMQTTFLPGQVENWVILLDLKYMTMGLPINALKNVLGYLQNNYRSRLYKMFILKTSFALNLVWKALKPFLEENTVMKIFFCKETAPEIFEFTNPAQIEQQYGGTALNKNEEQFWPPYLNNKDIQVNEKVELISKEKYIQMYQAGKLVNNKIYSEYVKNQ